MNVSWEAATDSDFKEYRLYRSQDNGTTWTLIHKTALRTYTDYKVLANTSYKYAVTIYDNYDRESLKKESDNVIALADTDAPVITGPSPATGSRINKTASISVLAQDNVGVTNIKLELVKSGGNVLIGENTRVQSPLIQRHTQMEKYRYLYLLMMDLGTSKMLPINI